MIKRRDRDRRYARVMRFGTRGAFAAEFALIAPVLLLLIFGTIGTVLSSAARISLDSAVQSLAYDAVNAGATLSPMILSRATLCQKSSIYLVDCNSASDFCFSVTPLVQNGQLLDPVPSCNPTSGASSFLDCCYQITAQYILPAAIDVQYQISLMLNQDPKRTTLRAVAFIYRS